MEGTWKKISTALPREVNGASADSDKVYFSGQDKCVEYYDPVTSRLEVCAQRSDNIHNIAAVNGMLYSLYTDNELRICNPKTNSWDSVTVSCVRDLNGSTVYSGTGSEYYLIMSSRVYRFDTATNEMTAGGKQAPIGLAIPHGSAILGDNIYCVPAGSGKKMAIYHIPTDTWTVENDVPTTGVFSCVAYRGKLVVLRNSSNVYMEIYDPELKTWEQGPVLYKSGAFSRAVALQDHIYLRGKDGLYIFGDEHAEMTHTITHMFVDEESNVIREPLARIATDGQIYTANPLSISGYIYTGYYIDDGGRLTGTNITIDDVQKDYTVTFIYAKKDSETPDPDPEAPDSGEDGNSGNNGCCSNQESEITVDTCLKLKFKLDCTEVILKDCKAECSDCSSDQ